jgi:hypothetical protein
VIRFGKLIWAEPACTLGRDYHETVWLAWQRLFGEVLDPSKAVQSNDLRGPTRHLLMPNGHIAVVSRYPGNSAIYQQEN